ncbi:MAG TPA: leucine-rich repeat domain-containing protein [Paludibacter sp.]
MKTHLIVNLLFSASCLFFSLNLQAQEVTKTINVETAGTLNTLIPENEKYTITDLTLTGALNGYDICIIRRMAGRDSYDKITSGHLTKIDLSEANIVSSGFIYYTDTNNTDYTSYTNAINDYTFYNCSGLKQIILPNSATYIGSFAFKNCTGLISISIPKSITWIIENAFEGCKNVASFNVENENTTFSSLDGVLFNKDKTALHAFPIGKGSQYTIPNEVKTINSYAFSGCSGLTAITIGNNVTTIGEYAFGHCKNLTQFNVDSNNTAFCSVDGVLFNKDQTSLIAYPNVKGTQYTIPNSVKKVESYAFEGCTGLTDLTFGDSVITIGSFSFRDCSGLTSLSIGKSINLSTSAFQNCTGLKSIVFGDSIRTIGDYVFKGCTSLEQLDFGNGIKTIKSSAFEDCTSLTSVIIGKSLSEINNNTFYNCSSLSSITFGERVKTIGSSAFRKCVELKSPINWKNVRTIKSDAFNNCTGLTSLAFGDSIRTIEDGAFFNCTSLNSVNIGSVVDSIGGFAFSYCKGLTQFNVDNSNKKFCSFESVLFDKNMTDLVTYPNAKSDNYTIPNTVRTLRDGAFSGCSELKSISYPIALFL